MPDFDFSTLITDRSQADVDALESLLALPLSDWTAEQLAAFNQANSKGAYNYTDLNRVTACMEYLNEQLRGYGYQTGYSKVTIPHKAVSALPDGYTQVEYIESTGTQYINTGFTPNQDTRVVCDVVFPGTTGTSGKYVFGSRTALTQNSYTYFSYNRKYETTYNTQDNVCYQNLITGRFIIDKNKNVTTTNGTAYSHTYANFTCPGPLYLFALNNNGSLFGGGSLSLYSCQIYDNETLVRDFIPCIDAGGEVGLYDLVNDAFYGNAGTGDFIAGPEPVELPDGYTQVEYIESSGTQYVDTKVVPDGDTVVYMDFQLTNPDNTNQCLFGTAGQFSFRWFGSQGYFRSNGKENSNFPKEIDKAARHTVEKTATACTIDQSYTVSNTAGDVTLSLTLFSQHGASNILNYADAKCYSIQIYMGDELVRDYIPCKNPSGAAGLYDRIGNQFYGNAGSGTFTAGPEVPPPAPVPEPLDPYTWYESDVPTASLMGSYLDNVTAIRAVLELLPTTPETPETMAALTWVGANDIERILVDVQFIILRVVNAMARSNSFTFWSGNLPFPTAESNLGRTWAELDAMETTWANWQVATWYLLLYGNLEAEGVVN